MFLDRNKIYIFFLLLSLVIGLFLRTPEKVLTKHNTLKTDYVKVTITWESPNNAPTFSAGPAESPASAATTPTNVGSDVNFYATGTDPDGNNYYFAVCKTSVIATTSNGAPTCSGGKWCISGSTASGAQATCATTTAAAMSESNNWYAFICDHNANSMCSSVSSGSGDSGSPFEVNHVPSFSAASTDGPKAPGTSITFSSTASDPDSTYSDTVKLVVCKTQGVSGTACDGGDADTWCTSSLSASNPSCSFNMPAPAAHGNTSSYVYVFDNHDLAASGGVQNTQVLFEVSNAAPINSSLLVNGGATINLSTGGEGPTGNKDISGTAIVTDNNGCDDVVSVVGKMYPSGLGAASCTSQNNNNCYYNISCTGGTCSSGINKTYTCTANFKYHADPTDESTPRAGESWMLTVVSSDEALSDTDESVSGVTLQSYSALNASSTIPYGVLGIGEIANTTALSTTTVVSATGNTGLDVRLSGTDMTGGGTIGVAQQKYATSGVQYQSAISLSATPTELELNLKKTTTTNALSGKSIYWGLQIPTDSPAASYSGTNTFEAVKAEVADW